MTDELERLEFNRDSATCECGEAWVLLSGQPFNTKEKGAMA